MIEISTEELQALTEAINYRYDIDFTCYEPKSLKRRISRSLSVHKLESIHHLWQRLLHERDFIHPFIDELTVGLTSMFRDPPIWKEIKALLEERDSIRPLHIWHAGCSTGEEVYTMSIVLKEANIRYPYKALATDLNAKFLQYAQAGTYLTDKKREFTKHYLEYNPSGNLGKYCTEQGASFTLHRQLHEHVVFKQHNLVSHIGDEKYDIIFCRNVMIYFDKTLKSKVIDQFYKQLKPGGLMIIGYFDSIFNVLDRKKFQSIDKDHKIYQKIN